MNEYRERGLKFKKKIRRNKKKNKNSLRQPFCAKRPTFAVKQNSGSSSLTIFKEISGHEFLDQEYK